MANIRTNTMREDALDFYLDDKYGPPPYNNFKALRTQRGYSLQQMASFIGISKNALVRLENGTFANPLDAVVTYWVKQGYGYNELREGYCDFQYYMRKRHNQYFGSTLAVIVSTGADHPLRQLRRCRPSPVDRKTLPVGIEQVSRDLCLPVDTLRHFEKKWRRQQSVPKALKQVLLFLGYNAHMVRNFEAQYKTWRRNQLTVTTLNLLGTDGREAV